MRTPFWLYCIYTSYATILSGIPWNIHGSLVFSRHTHKPFRQVCMPRKYKWQYWDIPRCTTREHCITILYHAIENTVASTINATYAQRMMERLDVTRLIIQRLSCILIGSILHLMASYKYLQLLESGESNFFKEDTRKCSQGYMLNEKFICIFFFSYSKPLKNCVLLTTGCKQDLCWNHIGQSPASLLRW